MNIKIEVEGNYPNRFSRGLNISVDNASIETGEFDCRSDQAKELAIDLMAAAMSILNHHELFKGDGK